MADFTANATVDTVAQPELVGKAVDTILSYSPLTLFFLANQKKWKGTQIQFPIKYASNTQGMSFDGLEKFSTVKTNNWVKGTVNPTGREINCVISGIERDVANSGNQVADLVERQLTSDAHDMASDIAGLFYQLQTGKNFLSVLDGVDDTDLGTTTYLGLSRATYTGLNGNVTAVGGNLTATLMATMYNSCVHGNSAPNLIITTKAVETCC